MFKFNDTKVYNACSYSLMSNYNHTVILLLFHIIASVLADISIVSTITLHGHVYALIVSNGSIIELPLMLTT